MIKSISSFLVLISVAVSYTSESYGKDLVVGKNSYSRKNVQKDLDRRNGYAFKELDMDYVASDDARSNRNPFKHLQQKREKTKKDKDELLKTIKERRSSISGKNVKVNSRLLYLRRKEEALLYDISMLYRREITPYHNQVIQYNNRLNSLRAKRASLKKSTTEKYQKMIDNILKLRREVIQKAVDRVMVFEKMPTKNIYMPTSWKKAWIEGVDKSVHSKKTVKKKAEKPVKGKGKGKKNQNKV